MCTRKHFFWYFTDAKVSFTCTIIARPRKMLGKQVSISNSVGLPRGYHFPNYITGQMNCYTILATTTTVIWNWGFAVYFCEKVAGLFYKYLKNSKIIMFQECASDTCFSSQKHLFISTKREWVGVKLGNIAHVRARYYRGRYYPFQCLRVVSYAILTFLYKKSV